MSTTRTFQAMLNEYLPNKLLKEELIKRDYILSNIQKDNAWKGGDSIVPFKGAGASSVRMGKLTAESDISEDVYVRGKMSGYKEAYGSMVFNFRDLVDHEGKIPESTFLKILPDTIEEFMEYMKMVVSHQLGCGAHFASGTVNGTVGGVIIVDRIDRFVLGQKVHVKDNDTAGNYYVIAIDINTNAVTFSATRGGAAADMSAFTVAAGTKFYIDGAQNPADSFQSIVDALLPNASPFLGSASLHGVTKSSYPFLQAVAIDGVAGAWTPANIIEKLFDGYTTVRTKARGKATKILMDYKVGAAVLKKLETGYEGQYSVTVSDKKASPYGWDEVVLKSKIGHDLTVVMIQEWETSKIVYWDPSSMTFRSNGFFRKIKDLDGNEYHKIRTEDGYKFICDTMLFGDLEVTKPGNNGIAIVDPTAFA